MILPLFGGGLHMCIRCCMCVVYVCAYVREKVMFEVYGSESESMSDQYGIFLFLVIYCISPYDSFYAGRSCFDIYRPNWIPHPVRRRSRWPFFRRHRESASERQRRWYPVTGRSADSDRRSMCFCRSTASSRHRKLTFREDTERSLPKPNFAD